MDNNEQSHLEENYEDYLSDIPGDYYEDSDDDELSGSEVRLPRSRVMNLQESSDSEPDTPDVPLDWSEIDTARNNQNFKATPGINIYPDNRESVKSVTSLFIGDDIFETISEETNKYYMKNKDKYKIVAHTAKWFDVTAKELKRFFGLIIIMGLVRKNTLHDYWSTNPRIETPYFRKTMSRNRFKQILTFFHVSDNNLITEDSERLVKVQNIIDYFQKKFQEVYTPTQNLSLDEGMIPWRGRLIFRVYNPMKIIKYGILNRMLCESKTGYICNFKLYCGISMNLKDTITAVVRPYFNKWYNIYADNFYNSVELANYLYNLKTRICGTIRANRGIPNVLKNLKLNIFESVFRRKGNVLVQVWRTHKKRDVRMISTIHQAEVVDTGRKDRKTGLPIKKPQCILDYNNYMSGVDLADQYLSYYPIFKKTKKWTKKVTMYLFNCAILNSFKIFQLLNPTNKIKFSGFLLKLAEAWLEDTEEIVEGNEPSTSHPRCPRFDASDRLSGSLKDHEIVKIVSEKSNKPLRRNCRVCASHKIRKPCAFMCKTCKVPLHVGECFQKYHTLKKF